MRKPPGEELDAMRVPLFIQQDPRTTNCDRSVRDVSQSPTTSSRMNRPHAEMWWHDEAECLIFTRAVCPGCKAIGQAF